MTSRHLTERTSFPEGGSPSGYKSIVTTRVPPVTLLEQFEPEKACEIVIGALKDGGWEEMHKFLGLRINYTEDES